MSTIRFLARIADDGTIHPPEGVRLAPGTAEVTVVQEVAAVETPKPPRTSLADWADQQAEHWGNRFSSADVELFTGRRF